MGKYMGTSEAAEQWNCSRDEVSRLCRIGKIEGAEHDGPGKPWRIPADTPNPFIKHGEVEK